MNRSEGGDAKHRLQNMAKHDMKPGLLLQGFQFSPEVLSGSLPSALYENKKKGNGQSPSSAGLKAVQWMRRKREAFRKFGDLIHRDELQLNDWNPSFPEIG
jgi:hypothetical protein